MVRHALIVNSNDTCAWGLTRAHSCSYATYRLTVIRTQTASPSEQPENIAAEAKREAVCRSGSQLSKAHADAGYKIFHALSRPYLYFKVPAVRAWTGIQGFISSQAG